MIWRVSSGRRSMDCATILGVCFGMHLLNNLGSSVEFLAVVSVHETSWQSTHWALPAQKRALSPRYCPKTYLLDAVICYLALHGRPSGRSPGSCGRVGPEHTISLQSD